MNINHVVMFGGGITSWMAARLVADEYGTDCLTLLFADTLIEDKDLYRFLDDVTDNIGISITRIADGRTPWEVFKDKRFIANSRVDICSRVLKRDLLSKWRDENCDPETTHIHFGITENEEHRLERMKARKENKGWTLRAPLIESQITKSTCFAELADEGIRPPRLYGMGFPHNNCGGFCVKAGHGQFQLLYRMLPELYLEHECNEERMRKMLGKDVSILRSRRGGKTHTLTLRQFRQRLETNDDMFQLPVSGGCGCALD